MFTWFDKLIAGVWILLLLAFGSIFILGDFSNTRIIQQKAGMLITQATKSTEWISQQIKLGLFESVETMAFSEVFLFQLLTQAAIALMKRLVQAFFGAIKKILGKFKEMISQAVSAISNSKIARDIAKILNFRINVCDEVDKWVNKTLDSIPFLKTGTIENTIQYSWNSIGQWVENTFSWAQPQPVFAQQDKQCEFRLFPQTGTSAQGSIKCITSVGCQSANTLRASVLSSLDKCATNNEVACREGLGSATESANKLSEASRPIFDQDSCGLLALIPSIRYNSDNTCKSSNATLGILLPVEQAFAVEKLIDSAKTAGAAAELPGDAIVKVASSTQEDYNGGSDGYIPAFLANNSIDLSNPKVTIGSTTIGSDSALNNFVNGNYVIKTQKAPNPDKGVDIATQAIGQASSPGGAGGDITGAIDALIDTIIQELTNIALQFLDTIFNAINTITCGVLNFQDFCNATTQLSSQVTKGAIQYFDNLKTSIKGSNKTKVGSLEFQNLKVGGFLNRDKKLA